ncbi:MAG: ABC transporter permease [Candidatus Zixiibacteriota bacterium]|nr:MAG: ABC transporter permease [candidate division Zixibacteria bacterium]
MVRNYFIVALRSLKKSKTFSALNILGLAIGMSACFLILHYVIYEKSYDNFHDNADRVYRLRYERTDEAGNAVRFASCCPPAAARIRGNYAEVEQIARLFHYQANVSHEEDVFTEERMFFAEPEVFGVLKITPITGDPAVELTEPDRAILSQTAAAKYFGEKNPIGQTITMNGKDNYEVTGIFADFPHNSHLKMDIILPWRNLETKFGPDYTEAWGHSGAYTYLLVSPDTDPAAFEESLQPMIRLECPWLDEYKMRIDLKMQPIQDIHLTSHYMQEHETNGDVEAVDSLIIVALFILAMAWINFVNLSTAFSLNRAKEVGLRKVAGASRRQLIFQFLAETITTNLIAIGLSLVIIVSSIHVFNQFTGIPTEIDPLTRSWFWQSLGLVFVAGLVFSGIYPAIAMSSFSPASVLKGRFSSSKAGIITRKILVVGQFTIGLLLIIATITVFRQLTFMRNQALGFEMEQTLVVRAPRVRGENYGSTFKSFKETILSRSDIEIVSHPTEVPGRQIYWDNGAIMIAGQDVDQGKNYQIVGIDYEFAELFGLEFVAGRNFSKEFPSDSEALILNETAVKYMGFTSPDSAIGKQVDYWGEIFTIVGIMKDFHQQSLREQFEPHIYRLMFHGRGLMGSIAMRINTSDESETVAAVKTIYDRFFPGNPFNFFFLDDYYNQQYDADEMSAGVYSLFTALAIIIIVLGIYGLASFNIIQQKLQIAIRKVLGATAAGIITMLIKEYFVLVALANLIAAPVAYFLMNRWLENFAFRTTIGIGIFLIAALTTVIIAFLSVIYQVHKAVHVNPTEVIANE